LLLSRFCFGVSVCLASVSVDDVRDVINVSSAEVPDSKVLKMIKRAEVTLELETGKETSYSIIFRLFTSTSSAYLESNRGARLALRTHVHSLFPHPSTIDDKTMCVNVSNQNKQHHTIFHQHYGNTYIRDNRLKYFWRKTIRRPVA